MIYAVKKDRTDNIKVLLQAGAEANAVNSNGRTALMLAVLYGKSAESIRALLAAGADVHVASKDGSTALMLAALYGESAESVRLLLEAGAKANAKSRSGVTALMHAAGNPDKTRLLLAAGADPNAADKDGETALMRAADSDAEAVRRLLAAGAAVNAADAQGESALMRAAKGKNLGAVTALLRAGADANLVDKHGYTARVWASFKTFQSWVLNKEGDPAVGCARLLREREGLQTRLRHWPRTARFWGRILTIHDPHHLFHDSLPFVVMLGLITAGLSYPLWIVLRGFGLPAAVRHLIFWPLLAGAAIRFGITTLREMWTGGESILSIFLMLLVGIILLFFVDLIILIVRSWRRK